jgi:hypothetical protein
MSDECPHYCDRCPTVILREADRELVYNNATREVLDKIAATLPRCPCGGPVSTRDESEVSVLWKRNAP